MHYVDSAVCSVLVPKLLGTYELELHDIIEAICQREFSIFVNIGAAEGYYAVGLAMRNPKSKVIAYESDPEGQKLIVRMAGLNLVEPRVEVRGLCDRPELQRALEKISSETLLLVDCEGAELILLDPLRCESLKRAFILVETHDFAVQGTTDELKERFHSTHDVREILQEERTPGHYPYSDFFIRRMPEYKLAQAVNERRPWRMRWLWMTPRSSR